MKMGRGVITILGALAALFVAGLASSVLSGRDVSPPDGRVSAASLQAATPAPTGALQISKRVASWKNSDAGGSGVVRPGAEISYTIDITNTGRITATGVHIVDDYPETFMSDPQDISYGGEAAAGKIVWDLGSLPAGGTRLVSYTVTLDEAFPPGSSNVENTAAVSSDAGLQATGASLVVVEQPDLTATVLRALVRDVDGDGTLDPGDSIKYVIEYANTGRVAATRVEIVHDYDDDLFVDERSIDRGGQEQDGTVVWNLGTVPVDHSNSVSYSATLRVGLAPSSANVMDTVTIDCDQLERVAVQGTLPVNRPLLTLLKKSELAQDVDEDGDYSPGDGVRYTIEYKNTGGAAATGVTLVDDYDRAHVRVVGFSATPGIDDGYTLSWDLDPVAAGKGGSVSYVGELVNLPVGKTEVRNRATIDSVELAPVSTVCSITVKVTPTPTPTPAPVLPDQGPAAGIFAKQPHLVFILLLVSGLGGVVGLIYAGVRLKMGEDTGNQRLMVILEGIAVHLIICAVIILALGGGIQADSAAAILSAVAGYVFGRVRSSG